MEILLQEESYMNLKKALPVLALSLGLAGGVLHGLDLAHGYDSAGLPTDVPWLTILYVLAVSAVPICIICARSYRQTSNKYQAFEAYLCGGGDLHKTAAVLCAAVFALCGLWGLYMAAVHLIDLPMFERLTLIPLYLLALLSCLTFVRFGSHAAVGSVSEQSANLIFIPIFWIALDMVNTFKVNGNAPLEGLFMFELLAAMSILCALNAYARFLFALPRPRLLAGLGALGVVFGLIGGVGSLFAYFMGSEKVDLIFLPRAGCYTACALWLAYQLSRMAVSDEPEGPALRRKKQTVQSN